MRNWTSVALATLIGTAGLSLAAVAPAFAEYPERPVTFIVPWPPGDLEDQLTRIIADEMTKATGQPAKVVNRPGGGAVEGSNAVATADPDGYTVGSLVIDVVTTTLIKGNAPFKRDSLEPVGIFLTYPFALVAKKDAPYNNMAELAAFAKTGKVKLGHFGYDLIPTMATFVAAKKLGFKFSADAPFDNLDCSTLSNGDADVINTTMATVLSCLDKIKVLAAYTDKPLSLFPDAKLLSEQVPGLGITLWNGFFVPKGTPQAVKDKLAAITEAAMKTQAAQDIAKATGAGVYWQNQADATARIAKAYTDAEVLVKDAAK